MDKELLNALNDAKEVNILEIAPNFRKTNITDEELKKIVNLISSDLNITTPIALVGMYLLFLQGAANAGTPLTMSVPIGNGKYMTKRNIISACQYVTNNIFIRRIAEKLAIEIGDYAEKYGLIGELGNRINNRHKASTGQNLTSREMAFCSSFSQSIPDLQERVSERLVQLLADDYNRRFESKRKSIKQDSKIKSK